MTKRIDFDAFHMNCVVHHSGGLWPHPENKMRQYTNLDSWIEVAKVRERGKLVLPISARGRELRRRRSEQSSSVRTHSRFQGTDV